MSEEGGKSCAEPTAKKCCIEVEAKTRNEEQEIKPSPTSKPSSHHKKLSSLNSQASLAATPKNECASTISDEVKAKKLQLVVGVNAVTRQLERGGLEAGLVCSTSPGVLYQHILPLSATQGVSFAAVPGLSEMLAKQLGIKRAMSIGWKV